MKSIMIQLKPNGIVISKVKSSHSNVLGTSAVFFPFPDGVEIDGIFDSIKDFAGFTNNCIKSAGYSEKKLVLVLDDDICLQKDFNHPKTNSKNLLLLARLEAEAVLHGTASEYSISCHQYGERTNLEGEYRSSLYALKTSVIKSLRNEFAILHHDLIRVVPRMNSFIYAVSALVNSPTKISVYADKCFAIISLNMQNIRVVVFDKATPIYSHTYASSFDDIIQIICEERALNRASAIEFLRTFDFTKPGEDELSGRIMILFNMMMENVIRSIHFSAASERLDVTDIVFSGSFSNHRGVIEYVAQAYEVTTAYIEDAFPQVIGVLKDKESDAVESMDRLSTFGAYKTPINLLWAIIAKKKEKISAFGVCGIMTALVVCTMLLQPAVIMINKGLTKNAERALYDEKFTEVRNVLSQRQALDDRLVLLEEDIKLYPYTLSKSNEYIEKMLKLFEGATVEAYSYDNVKGTISVSFIVKTYTDFIPINERVVKSETFDLSVPFTASQRETEVFYTVGLSIKDFKGFGI